MTFSEDYTFDYVSSSCFGIDTISGVWKRKDSRVILNGDNRPNEVLISGYEMENYISHNSDSLTVKLLEEGGDEVRPFITCELLKDDEVLVKNQARLDGICRLPQISANKLRVSFTQEFLIPFDSNLSYLELRIIEPEIEDIRYFVGERWILKKGEIIDTGFGNGKLFKRRKLQKID